MKKERLIAITAVLSIGAGCWSIGSKAEPSQPSSEQATSMTETTEKKGFLENLPKGFEQPTDDAGRLLLREYGAVFLARNGAVPPKKVVFRDEADVQAFQSSFKSSTETIGGIRVALQTSAMNALLTARQEAAAANLSISPRGVDSARRGYDQTVTLWASRVNPGFSHWVAKGRVPPSEASRIKSLSPYQQVSEILDLESKGIFFAKSLDKSIIYSVAPPGTSQHLSMLALDVKEFENAKVRTILAKHGWYQTVVSDLPHFTYIGVEESKLSGLGLKKVVNASRTFWIPEI